MLRLRSEVADGIECDAAQEDGLEAIVSEPRHFVMIAIEDRYFLRTLHVLEQLSPLAEWRVDQRVRRDNVRWEVVCGCRVCECTGLHFDDEQVLVDLGDDD